MQNGRFLRCEEMYTFKLSFQNRFISYTDNFITYCWSCPV